MTWRHLTAFVWLRWRLAVNQTRRSGPVGGVVSVIFTALMMAGGAIGLSAGLAVGYFALRGATPGTIMVVWDGVIAGFVFFWMVGLLTELQRSDPLSFDRFLHLPVSPAGAFLINYLGSSVTLSLVVFLPAMLGLAAGLALAHGPAMLVLFALVPAFFLMMTAVTYQFRGWLASLMQNPRRRRIVMAFAPFLLIVATQVPNLWLQFGPGTREERAARAERRRVIADLDEALAAGAITQDEYDARRPAPPADGSPDSGQDLARRVNRVVPPGWLAYGAEAAAEGRTWPALAGVLGMGLFGALSLRRAYRTTTRLYRGDFEPGSRRARSRSIVPKAHTRSTSGRTAFLERRVPWTSERAAAVALAGFRSWLRAPEMKLLLVMPVLLLVVFASVPFGRRDVMPELARTLSAPGLAAFMLIVTMAGPAGNQFGYDRGAFRAFVLGPVPRRELLLGKNLALLPFALLPMVLAIGVSHWFRPMRADHLAAALIQTVPMYLLFCLAANVLSILGPLTLRSGSGMPARHQGLRSVYPLLFMPVASIMIGLTFIPIGVEAALAFTVLAWFPASLVLGLLQAAGAVWIYRTALAWEGNLLHDRERRVLEVVAAKTE